MVLAISFFFFFFNDTATTEIYTLSLHDALPISEGTAAVVAAGGKGDIGVPVGTRVTLEGENVAARVRETGQDRKSTRLNSSHLVISYAVFCLKKKKHPRARTRSRLRGRGHSLSC